jgi:hypothetical protein
VSIALTLELGSYSQKSEPKDSFNYFNQRGRVMFPEVTANALLVWFVWGFFMAMGWVLGTWIMERLLGMVWSKRV